MALKRKERIISDPEYLRKVAEEKLVVPPRGGRMKLKVYLMILWMSTSGIGGWRIETIDEGVGGLPWIPAIGMKQTDIPCVAYVGVSQGIYYMIYAERKDTFWNKEQMYEQPSAFIISLSVDNVDKPHLAYRGSNRSLRYACKSGWSWLVRYVDYPECYGPSLDIDAYNRPHIAYLHSQLMGDAKTLRYTFWDGDTWQNADMDSAGASFPSLALDSQSRPHIVYIDTLDTLRYALWDGSMWRIEKLDYCGLHDEHPCLALDTYDQPHILYCAGPSAYLRYLHWEDGSWDHEVIQERPHFDRDLALDSKDHPHITWLEDIPCEHLGIFYGWWDGVEWHSELVDGDSAGGALCSRMIVDREDVPHLLYLYDSPKELRYTRRLGHGIGEAANENLKKPMLGSNLPNPFKTFTQIDLYIPEGMKVSLKVYDIAGQLIRTLLDGYMEPGHRRILWDGRDDEGARTGSGIYFYNLRVGNQTFVRKTILLN
jgi:hypothetical protein